MHERARDYVLADGAPADEALSRCPICGVPAPADEWRSQAADTRAWAGMAPWRDPYLARAGMHLCYGCDRIVQDERAWQLKKRAAGPIRCRVCNVLVPDRPALPQGGDEAEAPAEAEADYTERRLVAFANACDIDSLAESARDAANKIRQRPWAEEDPADEEPGPDDQRVEEMLDALEKRVEELERWR